MIFGPSYTTMAGAVFVAALVSGGSAFFAGIKWEKRSEAIRVDKQADEARTAERDTARKTFRLQEVRDADTLRIDDRLADALQRLRARPTDRVQASAATASAGATGRELSGPDSEFLERLAARADRLRSDLQTCRGWIEEVTKP